MRRILAAFAIAASSLAGCVHSGGADEDAIARQLAAPARSAEDRARDARDRPETLLAFAGFGRGDTIADIFGGGGYYSEILSGLVGPRGRVLLVNNAPYDAYAKKGWNRGSPAIVCRMCVIRSHRTSRSVWGRARWTAR